MLSQPHPARNHNGGLIRFGPDGLLYAGLGDGGGGGDQHGSRGNGQNLGSLLGKILRIDPRADGRRAYTVPSSNPFVDRSGARAEIYAYGLRNPWRWAFDPRTGNLVIADVGQGEVEEVSIVAPRGREPGLARVRGPQPLLAGRVGARPRPARDPALPLERQLLDHRRRRGPRPRPLRAARALHLRRPVPRA